MTEEVTQTQYSHLAGNFGAISAKVKYHQSASRLILGHASVLEHGKYDGNQVGVGEHDAGTAVVILKCELRGRVSTVCEGCTHTTGDESEERNRPRDGVGAEYHGGVASEQTIARRETGADAMSEF